MVEAPSAVSISMQFMDANTQDLMELIERTKKDFRFKYVGGGYFRDKNVPQGKKAEVRHGEEIIDAFCQELIRLSESRCDQAIDLMKPKSKSP